MSQCAWADCLVGLGRAGARVPPRPGNGPSEERIGHAVSGERRQGQALRGGRPGLAPGLAGLAQPQARELSRITVRAAAPPRDIRGSGSGGPGLVQSTELGLGGRTADTRLLPGSGVSSGTCFLWGHRRCGTLAWCRFPLVLRGDFPSPPPGCGAPDPGPLGRRAQGRGTGGCPSQSRSSPCPLPPGPCPAGKGYTREPARGQLLGYRIWGLS